LSEGLLQKGENFGDAVKDHAVEGFTILEQPFINIYKKATGQDFYGAALSVMATYQMTKQRWWM